MTGAIRAYAVDNVQAAAGIKQALTEGTLSAVKLVGRPGGYSDDPAIKILLPKPMQPIAKSLRAMGMGHQIDQFEQSMNQAAEAAAPKAVPIFQNAITHMTVSDAQAIVRGGKTSATQYFKAKTSHELADAFTPIVKQSMARYDATKQYDALMGKCESSSPLSGFLGHAPNLDITHYVVEKALVGLFLYGRSGRAKNPYQSGRPGHAAPREVFGGH